MAHEHSELHPGALSASTDTRTLEKEEAKTEAPKGTVLILGLYAALIAILWGMMYFDLILRR